MIIELKKSSVTRLVLYSYETRIRKSNPIVETIGTPDF